MSDACAEQRLGVYFDGVHRVEGDDVFTSPAVLPFLLFVLALGDHFRELSVFGRRTTSVDAAPLPVGAPARMVAVPYYESLADLRQVAGALRGFVRQAWRGLDDVDVLLVFGPHPLALVIAVLGVLRGKRVVLGSREDTMAYFRTRLPSRRWTPILAPLWLVDAAFRGLARLRPALVVGHHLERRFGGPRPGLLPVEVSLVSERDVLEPGDPAPWGGTVALLSVGRLAREKNSLLLADVVRRLEDRRPGRFRLTVVGTGELEEPLRRRVDELGVAHRVSFAGFVPFGPALLDLYRASDVFVHTAHTEAFGQVLVEAMASGTAIVATGVGGVPDLLAHGRAGVLVPPDDAGAIATAILELEDRARRASLLRAGHDIATAYTLEATAAKVAAFVRP